MVKSAKQSTLKAKNKELRSRGKPRRPLSSYNIFFALQRKKILDEQHLSIQDGTYAIHTNVGFANLANIVAKRWKNVDPEFKADEARAFLETMKKELEQMKPRFHETDVCENENTAADANSKTNGDKLAAHCEFMNRCAKRHRTS